MFLVGAKDAVYSKRPILALGPMHLPVQWVPGLLKSRSCGILSDVKMMKCSMKPGGEGGNTMNVSNG